MKKLIAAAAIVLALATAAALWGASPAGVGVDAVDDHPVATDYD